MIPGIKFTTIDEYFASHAPATRRILKELRAAIKKAAPQAEEKISYNMPAFKLHGPLVYYAAYKNHIGFYPTASGISTFQKELSGYEVSKGTVRFPLDKPLPLKLVTRIVSFRVAENEEKNKRKNRAGSNPL